jgi:ferredoxin-NADP reductase
MSILRQATKDQLPQPMILLYSNRRPQDAAFLVELQQLARENSNLQLIATMTQMEKSGAPWDGETGPIDERLVRRICGKLPAPICYLVGPPGMVESMRETLSAAGVNDDDIRSEEFYGY